MGFFASFLISLAFMIVGELLRPKPKTERAKPSALGDFRFPTVDPSRAIPIFFGTCKLAGPNVTWFGDKTEIKLTKKVKSGLFSSSVVDLGFQYYLGVQCVFSWTDGGGIDEIIDFLMDDKSVLADATVTDEGDYWTVVMNSPTLLGAEEPQNGVSGTVRFYKGTFTQPSDPYLQAQWGETETSAFRPLFHAVFEHCYLGNSDTPPAPTVIARRTPNPLGIPDGKHNVNGDCAVPTICYELMTNLMYGIRIDPSRIDVASFLACADQLYAEGFGLSMILDTSRKGREVLTEVLRHVDGVIYPDPQTKMYTMALARPDYDEDDLPEFTIDNTEPDSWEFTRVSWADTINTTVINYTDRESDFQVLPVTYRDPANVYARRGQIDSESIDFLGISNATVAMNVAARVNATRSAPLAKLNFRTNREGWTLRPAGVIKVSRSDYGLNGFIMRINDISYGTLDDPAVKVSCIQDIFSKSEVAFDPPPNSGWIPLDEMPVSLVYSALAEIPYGMLQSESRYVMALGVRDDEAPVSGFDVWSDPAGGTAFTKTAHAFGTIPGGTLKVDFDKDNDTSFTVENLQDPSLIKSVTQAEFDAGLSIAKIGNEWIAWKTATAGTGEVVITDILRGVFDSVEEDHVIGDVVYFLSEYVPQTAAIAYPEDITLKAKLPTYYNNNTTSLGAEPTLTQVTDSRAQRPNPPGAFRLDGMTVTDAEAAGLTGAFDITWAHRNKTIPGIVSQNAGDQEPEAGTTYTLEIYDGATLVTSKENIAASPASVNIDADGTYTFKLWAVNSRGQKSLYAQQATVAYVTAGGTTGIGASDAGPPGSSSSDKFIAVRVVSTAPLTLSGPQTVDTVALVEGDRILVNGQADAKTNGPYVVRAGAWTRADDADESTEFYTGKQVYVAEGTNASTVWAMTTTGIITLGTSDLIFGVVGSSGTVPTGTGWRHVTGGVEDAAASTPTAADVGADPVGSAAAAQAAAEATAAGYAATAQANAESYADGLVVGLWDDRGSYNASGNVFPSSGGSGTAGAILKGDLWTISVAGTLGGHPVTAGDTVRALVDSPGSTDANWAIAENNIGYVPENIANKDTDGTLAANSDTKYASQKAVKTYVDAQVAAVPGGDVRDTWLFG
jgi:hypothetical protein